MKKLSLKGLIAVTTLLFISLVVATTYMKVSHDGQNTTIGILTILFNFYLVKLCFKLTKENLF